MGKASLELVVKKSRLDCKDQGDCDGPDANSRTKKIIYLHEKIIGNIVSALINAIRIGQLLTSQKQQLKHGDFTPWVAQNLPFSQRTARNYMLVFRERHKLKTENVTDLSEAYKVLRRVTWSQQERVDHEGNERKFLTLSLDGIQNEVIMTALDKAKELLESASTARALEHISYDWFMSVADDSELIPLRAAKKLFEKIYNVKITITRK